MAKNYLEINPRPSSFFGVIDPDFNEKDFDENKSALDLKTVTPQPGVCGKAKTVTGEKVFINLCHSADIPSPPPSFDLKKITCFSSDDFLREVPLVIGELRIELDYSGNECKCYDVLINSDFYQKLATSKTKVDYIQFLLSFACVAIKDRKCIDILSETVKRLNKPYHGTMPLHFVDSKTNASLLPNSEILCENNNLSLKDSPGISSLSLDDGSNENFVVTRQDVETIIPKDGKCFKCKTLEMETIFINVCHSPEVPPPHSSLNINTLMGMSVKECINKIPMSLGDPHVELDFNTGSKCRCYDVVINSDFYKDICLVDSNKNFYWISLACAALQVKYGFAIDIETLQIQSASYQGVNIVSHKLKLDSKSKNNRILLDDIISKEEDSIMLDSPLLTPSIGPDLSGSDLLQPKPMVKAITPTPGLCVKGKTDDNEKIFINMCHHPDVPAPASSMKVEDIIDCKEESLFRFPLSIGEPHIERDKTGNGCKCYDIVINSDYFKEVSKNGKIRDFLLVLTASTIERKYDMSIDVGTFKILNKPYHGEMPKHFIRIQPKDNNSNLPFFNEPVRHEDEILMPIKDSTRLIPFRTPEINDYDLFSKSDPGSVSLLIFQGICSSDSDKNNLVVFVSNHKLTIEDTKGKNLLSICLPNTVSPMTSVANFWNNRLIVAMPVMPSDL